MTAPGEAWPTASPLVSRLQQLGIDADDSARRRMEYAYDASNYRVQPLAVAFPRSIEEVRLIVKECRSSRTPITARGGGTSMAGNAVGPGLIVDLSRHMHAIDEIEGNDSDGRTVWVDGGVILGELRARIEEFTEGALTFAPDPSSMSRATIGGAIGNDACGNHSVAYGRMSHHIQTLELITSDGAHLVAAAGGVRAAQPSDSYSGERARNINRALSQLAQSHLALLRTELHTIPRQVSGYHLGQLLPESGFNIARALAGSEGSCAIVVRAQVALVPRAPAVALLCVGYDSTIDSARDVTIMLAEHPSAVEGLDRSIVEIMRHRRGGESINSLPVGKAYVLIEFSGDTAAEARTHCESLAIKLAAAGRMRDSRIVSEAAEQARLWRIREDGAGLSSKRLDGTQTWPGWEDSAVAPERLADYLSDLLPLIDEYGYTAALYGHFGAGCVHMRIDFDLRSTAGQHTFAEFMRAAARIVVAHGGSLSGEHGDGRARGSLLPLMYSPGMLQLFAEFKRVWDPAGLLNPGIMVDPNKFTADLALTGMPSADTMAVAVQPISQAGPAANSPVLISGASIPSGAPSHSPGVYVGNAHSCIGVGRCRSMSGGFMCPSYRATKDEKDSTRGRARVLQELVRGNQSSADGWKSPEVRDALDLCLSCKACASDCPTGVDIADAKSVLMSEHYRDKRRPFTHYSIGQLPRWLPLLTRLSWIANQAARLAPLRRLGERLGISERRTLPAFVAHHTLRKQLREARFSDDADVLLFADSFTRAFRPEVIPAAARVLRSGGKSVGCTPDACCGLTWVSTGQRDAATKLMTRLVHRLDDRSGREIVVLEPSCAATMRDDLPKFVGTAAARRVAARVRPFSIAVDELMDEGWRPEVDPPAAAVLQTHCHEHAVFGSASQRRVLQSWGVPHIAESSSCCGVAGNFGFESDHFDVSMQIAEHSIVPALTKGGGEALVLTDGFSCATQVSQLEPLTTSEHLAVAMDPRRKWLRSR